MSADVSSGSTAATTTGAAATDASAAATGPVQKQQRWDHPRAQHAIIAAARQRGNPILSCIKSTPVDFADDLLPDYLAGPSTALLFISLRFQRLHPEYLQRRIQHLGKRHRTRVVLCRVDLEKPDEPLEQVSLTTFHGECSLLLAFTDAEAAAYLETLHRYQHKGAEALMGKMAQGDSKERLTEVLTTVKGVNKTDAASLASRFGSFAGIARATEEELQQCPGIGDKKVRQLRHVFHAPFFPG
eukprot:TRINITY_DN32830_c0_g1_i1.p1 TRINITY_DN32830_c0_g1~~TRINITY_DN32830_c0_g1_i1.p1  ORF type:complete len:243 (-),score=50.19 TRINITY_DN32830_c0_g1_i1:335-1063(-)